MLQERSITQDQQSGENRNRQPVVLENGFVEQILDTLEQGVIIWSVEATCLMHNARVFDVLHLRPSQIGLGTTLETFLRTSESRGDAMEMPVAELLAAFSDHKPFHYEIKLASGQIISVQVRPTRGAGHIVAFTDVTETRRAISALEDAKAEAARAEQTANEVLADERGRKREVSLLAQMDEWLQSCQSLDELYEIVTVFMQRILPGTRGQLFIYANSRDVLEQACAWQFDQRQDNFTPDSCWALRRGRSYTYSKDSLGFVCDHVDGAGRGDAPPRQFHLCANRSTW